MTIEFIFTSPLILEETFPDHIIVECTLLTEGRSIHGKLYTVEDTDFNLVAETAVNKPIYYGVDMFGQHKAPKVKGMIWSQSHIDVGGDDVKSVGKIVESWFDKLTRKVKAKLKIWEPNLIRDIRKGFKISVRGIFNRFKDVIYKGKHAMKVFGLKIKDIQIVPPSVKTGVKGAKVEKILEETMEFSSWEWDVGAVIGKLVATGEI